MKSLVYMEERRVWFSAELRERRDLMEWKDRVRREMVGE